MHPEDSTSRVQDVLQVDNVLWQLADILVQGAETEWTRHVIGEWGRGEAEEGAPSRYGFQQGYAGDQEVKIGRGRRRSLWFSGGGRSSGRWTLMGKYRWLLKVISLGTNALNKCHSRGMINDTEANLLIYQGIIISKNVYPRERFMVLHSTMAACAQTLIMKVLLIISNPPTSIVWSEVKSSEVEQWIGKIGQIWFKVSNLLLQITAQTDQENEQQGSVWNYFPRKSQRRRGSNDESLKVTSLPPVISLMDNFKWIKGALSIYLNFDILFWNISYLFLCWLTSLFTWMLW